METKVISFFACFAFVTAGLLPEKNSLENFDSHPSYKFNYNVDDSITGDVKAQTETREGDFVQGQYSLNDADGYKRTVDYTSDSVNGFNAVVRREPLVAPEVIAPKQVAPPKPERQTIFKSIVQTPTVIRTYSAPTTVVHHQPTVYHHAAPHTSVHLTPSAHLVHAAPAATLVKTYHHAPAVVHHSPTVLHHAPASYVHYH